MWFDATQHPYHCHLRDAQSAAQYSINSNVSPYGMPNEIIYGVPGRSDANAYTYHIDSWFLCVSDIFEQFFRCPTGHEMRETIPFKSNHFSINSISSWAEASTLSLLGYTTVIGMRFPAFCVFRLPFFSIGLTVSDDRDGTASDASMDFDHLLLFIFRTFNLK